MGMLILQCFKSLRCVRNQIHTHFMLATFLRGVVWISSVFIVSHHPVSPVHLYIIVYARAL
ncbi:hypothetical protein AHF37_12656 [Paragonimus kellicotti]|nr:hypothetical protein AHF37_12656 [Paragonimus kellicotti]